MGSDKNTLLIIDDDSINISVLRNILDKEYDVYVEKDGLSGIERAKELSPDLILLDIVMPAMSGFEVMSKLKNENLTRYIPVIFVTGLANTKDEERGFILGAADYINKPFSASVVKMRVRNQIRIINQMRQIEKLSVTDTLTGTGNRRYFDDQLNQEWHRAIRQQSSFGLIILDIDNFKNLNDTYGHLNGDIVLATLSKVIKLGFSRVTDKLARWGGEEFALILPDTSSAGTKKVAEKVRILIENNKFMLEDGKIIKVTVSIGVHSVMPQYNGEYTIPMFISDADAALYHAKRTGKNCVVAFSDIEP